MNVAYSTIESRPIICCTGSTHTKHNETWQGIPKWASYRALILSEPDYVITRRDDHGNFSTVCF